MWRHVIGRVHTALKVGAAIGVLLVVGVLSGQALAADDGNRLKSVGVEAKADGAEVLIRADDPIGYRYTVYDSQDPRRIVIDFRGMDVSGIASPISSSASPVSEVRVSSFDLTSGKLGRVEVFLDSEGDYNVTLDERNLTLTLAAAQGVTPSVEPPPAVVEDVTPSVVAEPAAIETATSQSQEDKVTTSEIVAEPQADAPAVSSAPAKKVQSVVVEGERVLFQTDGDVQMYKYFTLTGPTRLVVDVYKVQPGFTDRAYALSNGFKKLRVGVYKDKLRFVFDSAATKLPDFGVNKENGTVIVAWGASKEDLSTPLPEPASGPVAIEALDFYQEDATSVFSITLNGHAREIRPAADGNIIRFGIQNATIGRELRRVFDSSAFPSSIRMVTPYTVQRPYGQDVMFAVDMKGPVDYRLDPADKTLKFIAENDAFNEMAPASIELREVEAVLAETQSKADATAMASKGVAGAKVLDLTSGQIETSVPTADIAALSTEPMYTGQKITLVFDNADIRDILQLIADVSNMNVIAGDDVKGNLSIRLVDVPWDQALDIVLDIKGLGKVETNNVVRIMPKDKIREDESAELDALDLRRQKAPLETRVIPVSYTDITTISAQVNPLLTRDRGTITEDSRNKQLIVTDIAEVLDEVENLVKVLDTPERQVMIEARIVEANTNFSRDLGVNWGVSWDNSANASTGDLNQAQIGGGGSFLISPPSVGGVGGAGLGSNFLFGNTALDSTIIDLRLSALETTGTGKVISTPRVTTLNGKNATIKQGTKIPYVAVGDDGAETKFESAELKLDVTPEINPDRSIILEINASNSTVGATVPTGVGNAIAIDNKEANTSVLVKDGETVVIGGIFVEDDRKSDTGVPLLKDIPILGHLFKSTTVTNERRELLIFITPRILN